MGTSGNGSLAPAWSSVHSYNVGDKVTYQGIQYIAKNATTGVTPGTTDDWTNEGGQGGNNSTNSRVALALMGPTSSITGGSPGSSLASSALSSVPSGGTTATIDGTVVAGGSVNVLATDNLSGFGLGGALAGGFVGVGAGVLILNVEGNTDAGIVSE